MDNEFLKPILGDDLYAQFSEKMNSAEGVRLANIADGSFIPKAKYDEERTANKTYKQQVDELNGKLTALQEAAAGNDDLKNQIAKLQSDLAAKDTEMQRRQLEFGAREVIRGRKARNVDIVMRMIDMSKVTESNGQYYGLNEQLDALVKSDPFLFEPEHDHAGGLDPNKDPDPGKPNSNYSVNQLIRRAAGR